MTAGPLWIVVLAIGIVAVALVWTGHSAINASRSACEADGQHTMVRTYEGFGCIDAVAK